MAEQGFTQEQIAKQLGVHIATMYRDLEFSTMLKTNLVHLNVVAKVKVAPRAADASRVGTERRTIRQPEIVAAAGSGQDGCRDRRRDWC